MPALDCPLWWQGAAIYQVYPRSFADTNGDGIGDLPGITAHLAYIASLGVDAVWISPFFTSPMLDYGYDVADYCNVDAIFGTLSDFDRLIARAHSLGLRVIIDQVYSHTSSQHAWFKQSRADRVNSRSDWYVWADAKLDGSPPTNWQSVFGGPAWTWDARRGQYYLHNFLASQPDLHIHNLAVQNALLDCARFWLDRGVDGFRLDAVDYAMHDPQLRDNPPATLQSKSYTRPLDFQQAIYNKSHPNIPRFIERIRALTDSYGDRFTVAEVGGVDTEITMQMFTAGATRFHSAYGFNFLYAEHLSAELVRSALAAWPDTPGMGWPSWAFSNHDAPRAISRWSTEQNYSAFAPLMLLLLASLRGNIFLYQGEELGLPQAALGFDDLKDPEAIVNWPLTLGRDGARTPFPWQASAPHAGFSAAKPWLPIDDQHVPLSVDVQERDPASMLHLTRRIMAFRRRDLALRCGSLRSLESSASLLRFERVDKNRRLLCMFNFAAHSQISPPLPAGQWLILEAVGTATLSNLPMFSGFIAVFESP